MRELQKVDLEKRELENLMGQVFAFTEGTRFYFPLENAVDAWCIGMKQNDWEHVALDLEANKRCPTYQEMCRLKEYFFSENEIALQIHPRRDDYVNECYYRLHLWRNKAISDRGERALRRKIIAKFEEAKRFYKTGKKQEILFEGNDEKVVVLFGGDKWPKWNEVCKIKQKYWQPEEVAVQFNIGQKFDLNAEHIIMLWDAGDFALPSKELV